MEMEGGSEIPSSEKGKYEWWRRMEIDGGHGRWYGGGWESGWRVGWSWMEGDGQWWRVMEWVEEEREDWEGWKKVASDERVDRAGNGDGSGVGAIGRCLCITSSLWSRAPRDS
jgi:hypothetical protein